MQPTDLDLLRVPGTATVHPDGSRAVVSVVSPDTTADEYVGQLWSVRFDQPGTDPEPAPALSRLTRGHRDTEPQFSPDGRLLAFLRAEKGGKPQLHVVPAAGGEPLRLTDAPLGVGAPRWSPDGRRIAYAARVPEQGRYGTTEGVSADAEPARLITTLRYRGDGVGFLLGRPYQLFVVDVPDSGGAGVQADEAGAPVGEMSVQPLQVTDGDDDSTDVCWSPDGELLAFVSARHDDRDTTLTNDLHVCAPDGTNLRRVTATTLSTSLPQFSPDGTMLWFLASDPGPDALDFVGRTTGLYSVPVDGSRPPVRHTDEESIDLGEAGSMFSVTADGVLVQNRTRGSVQLMRVPLDSSSGDASEPQVLLGGPRQVRGHGVNAVGVLVATVADASSSGELVLVETSTDGGAPGERRLTDLGAGLRSTGRVHDLREVTITADDGYPVHGWVVLPPGEGPHPVLLTIHGGPYAQYGWGLFDEAQVYAGAGYAVLLCNPRGAAGYGQEHGRSIKGAMGQRDAADILAFLDGVLADDSLPLDDRVGVMGGSYGGYMTAWLVSHTDRFVACVVERGFLDPESFAGSADIGWFFGGQYLGTDPEQVRAQSAMARVDRITTPTLVVHSEQDWRCPVEQGQRLYVSLKQRGVDTAFLLFPGEGHELTRSGRPRHRLERFEHLLRWWARHLPVSTG